MLTDEQSLILAALAAWADRYPCIKAMYVFGSVARSEATAESDLDLAIEYSNPVDPRCYTKVNEESEELAEDLKRQFGYQPKFTGRSPYAEEYDHIAWRAIRNGREVWRLGKTVLVHTSRG